MLSPIDTLLWDYDKDHACLPVELDDLKHWNYKAIKIVFFWNVMPYIW
jgi:hypothetical protein